MSDQDDTERTAALLKAALHAAADVMVVHDVPERQPVKRTKGRLFPFAAAASVAIIALGAVLGTHLASAGPAGAPGATQSTAAASRPEFYMTATYPASGPNVLQLQVRLTNGGAVTASRSVPASNLGWGGYLTAAAGDRDFFIAEYPCTRAAAPVVTTFYRITITDSGRISGIVPAGHVQGMVTSLAVSPDGSQMAYNALPGACAGHRLGSTGAGSVSVTDLATGAVRTWQYTAGNERVSDLSWAPDSRALIVDESARTTEAGWDLAVVRLDTTSGGGSLLANSTTLLRQNGDNCSTCVMTELAGPDGSLIALESQEGGQRTRLLVVSIPAAAGSHRTVLYSQLIGTPKAIGVNDTALFADSSGQWPLLWSTTGISGAQSQDFTPAGWISSGRLHPLTGVAQVAPQGIAW